MKRRSKSQPTVEGTVAIEGGGIGTTGAPVEMRDAKEGELAQEVNRLKQEIAERRATVAQKMAELRSLGGEARNDVSDTVRKVVELLGREEGATKAELVEGTGAKEAYIAALLNRILPSKGYSISSVLPEGAKVKTYRLPQKAAL